MAFAADHEVLLDRLDEELRTAAEPGKDIFCRIIAGGCTRIPVLSRSGRASRIDDLIECGAWADAALTVVEFELPAWRVRRLVCEDGEWLCSLSRQPNVPAELDDTVDAWHSLLPMAILRAFVEARRRGGFAAKTNPTVPQVRPAPEPARAIRCDNFA